MQAADSIAAPAPRRQWDPLVRVTHWGVAAAVLLNGLLTEEGGPIHVWVGYAALAILALRLLWGLIGPGEARFSAFPPNLVAARAHLAGMVAGTHRSYRSHNPLGALMVYALWASLATVTVSGVAMVGSPLAAYEAEQARHAPSVVDRERDAGSDEHGADHEENVLEEIHEIAANLLLVLAAFHVGGVALESRLSGRNLVREMLTGERTETRP